jgi:hypothetical protein
MTYCLREEEAFLVAGSASIKIFPPLRNPNCFTVFTKPVTGPHAEPDESRTHRFNAFPEDPS